MRWCYWAATFTVGFVDKKGCFSDSCVFFVFAKANLQSPVCADAGR